MINFAREFWKILEFSRQMLRNLCHFLNKKYAKHFDASFAQYTNFGILKRQNVVLRIHHQISLNYSGYRHFFQDFKASCNINFQKSLEIS